MSSSFIEERFIQGILLNWWPVDCEVFQRKNRTFGIKFGTKNEQNGTKKSPYSKGLICVNYSDKLLITPIHFVVVNIFSVFLACNSQYLIWTVGF